MKEAFSVKLQTGKLCFCFKWKLNKTQAAQIKNKNVVFKHFHQNIRPICTNGHFFLTIVTHNMYDNPKNNILVSQNIKQKGLTIMEYFNADIISLYRYIIIWWQMVYASKCSRIASPFCLIFSDTKMLFFGLSFILYLYQWRG